MISGSSDRRTARTEAKLRQLVLETVDKARDHMKEVEGSKLVVTRTGDTYRLVGLDPAPLPTPTEVFGCYFSSK